MKVSALSIKFELGEDSAVFLVPKDLVTGFMELTGLRILSLSTGGILVTSDEYPYLRFRSKIMIEYFPTLIKSANFKSDKINEYHDLCMNWFRMILSTKYSPKIVIKYSVEH